MTVPSSSPLNDQASELVHAGLTVRTAIRAGEGKPVDNIEQTVQGWWQNLLNALPNGQAAAPGTPTASQTNNQ